MRPASFHLPVRSHAFFVNNELGFIIMFKSFLADESGAQVVEYALIIAVVSIALVVALQALSGGTAIGAFIDRVTTCLGGTSCS